MECIEFVKATVLTLSEETFELLKDTLVNDYLDFYIVDKQSIDKDLLSEKLCDYFEKVELKTGKKFDKQLKAYVENLNDIVEHRLTKSTKADKKNNIPAYTPRARNFYEVANSKAKGGIFNSVEDLQDYTRIMMCLYAAVINKDFEAVDNLDFSLNCINATSIIESMRNEKEDNLFNKVVHSKNKGPQQSKQLNEDKPKFDIKDHNEIDSSTFVIAIIMLHFILDNRVIGD